MLQCSHMVWSKFQQVVKNDCSFLECHGPLLKTCPCKHRHQSMKGTAESGTFHSGLSVTFGIKLWHGLSGSFLWLAATQTSNMPNLTAYFLFPSFAAPVSSVSSLPDLWKRKQLTPGNSARVCLLNVFSRYLHLQRLWNKDGQPCTGGVSSPSGCFLLSPLLLLQLPIFPTFPPDCELTILMKKVKESPAVPPAEEIGWRRAVPLMVRESLALARLRGMDPSHAI